MIRTFLLYSLFWMLAFLGAGMLAFYLLMVA